MIDQGAFAVCKYPFHLVNLKHDEKSPPYY